MARITTLIITCLVSTVLYAQKHISVYGGINMSSTSTKDFKYNIGWQIGELYDIKISDRFYVQPRLSMYYTANETKENINERTFISQYGLSLPILASFRMPVTTNSCLRINAGPYIQYAIFGKRDGYYKEGAATINSGSLWWHLKFKDKLNSGAQLGVQYEYKNLIGMFDVKHAFRRSNLNYNGFENTFQLSLGYKF